MKSKLSAIEEVITVQPDEVESNVLKVIRAKVSELRPNSVNGSLFTVSLSTEGIESLKQDIAVRGVLQPILIKPNGEIIDGHRRWLACKALGLDYIPAIVIEGVDTKEDLTDYVLGLFSSARNPTVEERVSAYRMSKERLKERHGRRQGRQNKLVQNAPVYLTPEEIGEKAAKIAWFGSHAKAKKADKVFQDGDEALRAAVNAGEVSINEAYKQVMAAEKEREAATATDADATASTSPSASTSDQATDATSDPAPAGAKGRRKKAAVAEAEATTPTPVEEPGEEEQPEKEQPEEAASTSSAEAEERDPDDVLTRILPPQKLYLRRLAKQSLRDAKRWAKRIHAAVDEVMAEFPSDEDDDDLDL